MRSSVKLVPLLALMLAACGGGAAPKDQMQMEFEVRNGQPIPDAFPDPDRWRFLGAETVARQRQAMVWIKPVVMPRAADAASPGGAAQAVELFKRPEPFSGEWTERFEYQDLPRPNGTPAAYLEIFKAAQARSCASATVEAVRVETAELLLEARSGGCAALGELDEIDRFIFGRTDLFHMVYVVKAHDMTEAQRAVGLKAVNAWNIGP